MEIVINQDFAIKYKLSISEILVYSLMKKFNNIMTMNDIVFYLKIQNELSIKISVKSLIAKDLIVTERISDLRFLGVLFYKISKI